MKRSLALSIGLALSATAVAADPPATTLQALDARIRALETEAKQLREQTAAALSEASAARAELDRMKVAQAGTPKSAAPSKSSAEQSMEDRVAAVSASAPASEAASPPVAAPPPATSSAPTLDTSSVAATEGSGGNPGGANGNAFNPAIAVILNGDYAHHSQNPDHYVRAGFPLVPDTGPGPQGLSLGESEISFAANIDDKFYGQFTVSYHDDNGDVGTEIEEAYIDTLTLPDGFNLRAGRFYSNIGYLNSHHTHTDNFVDRPLPYQAFLGNQYGDDGAQVRWVAPTTTYLELGGEAFRGENYPSGGANHDGVGAWTAFAHAGGDIGDANSWLAGVSMLKTRATHADDGFTGDSTLYIADGTWKWAPNGNTKDGGVTVRSELFFDKRDGFYTAPDALAAIDASDPLDPASQPWLGDRRGGYLEAVWRLGRTWDVGYRFDKLWPSSAGPFAADFDPTRHSIEATWRNSEFSFFRIQYSHDDPIRDIVDNAIYLQYDVALGAHGAHKF
jgi:outer membrane murein-binding lipoprotein Lpp